MHLIRLGNAYASVAEVMLNDVGIRNKLHKDDVVRLERMWGMKFDEGKNVSARFGI